MSTTSSDRIPSAGLQRRVMPAEDAAGLISCWPPNVGMSGFTSAGYPKALPSALADRISPPRGPRAIRSASASDRRRHRPGNARRAGGRGWHRSAAPLPMIRSCQPRENQRSARWTTSTYICHTWRRWSPLGFLGPLDFAIVEAVGITEDGELIPSTSVGNNRNLIDQAEQRDRGSQRAAEQRT